jgi:hypothetical protein
MKPVISKITAKGQTTVLLEVRGTLKSKPGDLLAWEIARHRPDATHRAAFPGSDCSGSIDRRRRLCANYARRDLLNREGTAQ